MKSANCEVLNKISISFVLLIILIANIMTKNTESETKSKKATGNRIGCLTSPDPWNSMIYACDEKETVVPANGTKLDIIAGGQGAVAVKGWDRNEIKIRVVTEVWGNSSESTKSLLNQLSYKFAENKLSGIFSTKENYQLPWAVSFEVTLPNNFDVNLNTVNGAVYVDYLNGNISANAVNGAVYFTEVSGKVYGKSTNGRVEANVKGTAWNGESLKLITDNGDVAVSLPKNFNALLNAETERGSIFIQNQTYSFKNYSKKLNEGGKTITARSENGNILVNYSK
jgi:hypothetical protein